jgi:site-specific recombinase XerD
MAAYEAAMAGQSAPQPGASRTKPGTVNALVVRYFNSAEFRSLATSTQATYRNIIERFRVEHGDKRVAKLERRHLVDMLAKKVETPAAANNWLRMVRTLMQFAVSEGLRNDDPTATVKSIKMRSDGFEIWEDEHVAAYRERHALGTRPRLALELLLGTMQRRGDVVMMGRQHVRSGTLSLKQQKTGQQVDIPVLPELQAALDAMPKAEHLTFLVTEFGKSFTAAGFGNWFRDQCNAAGLPKNLSAHGLRKAGATRLAEHGCSDHEIMAWGGWTTLKEVARYTKRARRKQLAQSGADKIAARTDEWQTSRKV